MQAEHAGAVVRVRRGVVRRNAYTYAYAGFRTMISWAGCEKAPMI
jgi:hypothetical protein